MNIIKRPLGLYKANCYVLIKDGKSLIIDPGFHSKHIIEMVGDSEPIAVLLTHGHCDHVSALDEICEYYNIPAYLHPLDQELLQLIRRIIHQAIVLVQFVWRLVDIFFLEILYSNKM